MWLYCSDWLFWRILLSKFLVLIKFYNIILSSQLQKDFNKLWASFEFLSIIGIIFSIILSILWFYLQDYFFSLLPFPNILLITIFFLQRHFSNLFREQLRILHYLLTFLTILSSDPCWTLTYDEDWWKACSSYEFRVIYLFCFKCFWECQEFFCFLELTRYYWHFRKKLVFLVIQHMLQFHLD